MKTYFNLGLLLINLCLLFTCCHQIQSAKNNQAPKYKREAPKQMENQEAQYVPDSPLTFEEELEIEPPRTAESISPPPMPPVIMEAPEEEMIEDEFYFPSNKKQVVVNHFSDPIKDPLSTFSIDVDHAAYSHVRQYIMDGSMPPAEMVRIEEMINYFDYDYPDPKGEIPFSVNTEIATCPWNKEHQLVHIGLQGRKIPKENIPASNLVFLLDVSGSMNQDNKLPLLKKAFKMLISELRPEDRVAIVVYAGASGLVLPSTPGTHKRTIELALNQLDAGGGTAGADGIQLAYKIAKQHFIKDGNNRIILATDGDFNVGPNSEEELVHLIEKKRKQGIYLSVLGFGMNHYSDGIMEQLADNGNGNYAYIDNVQEARKVLVKEFSSTLYTIAKDVKLQIEFNPAQVKGYRLVGYENRVLEDRDFNDDQKDAGELGAGHSVTALYEIIPAGSDEVLKANVDDLKYQQGSKHVKPNHEAEWMNIKLRYKHPESEKSRKIVRAVKHHGLTLAKTSHNFRFSAAVAGFGMLLKNDPSCGKMNYNTLLSLAQNARGIDKAGYRAEFIRILELAGTLNGMDRLTSY